jgi:hypothetical protein
MGGSLPGQVQGGWRRHTRTAVPIGAIAATVVLLVAGIAAAAFHYTGSVYHGIGSSEAGGVGSGWPYAYSGTAEGANPYWTYTARMYHVRDDGGLNQQCATQSSTWARCFGEWGSEPCKKRAYTSGVHSQIGVVSPYHWMRGASCAGQTHQ